MVEQLEFRKGKGRLQTAHSLETPRLGHQVLLSFPGHVTGCSWANVFTAHTNSNGVPWKSANEMTQNKSANGI